MKKRLLSIALCLCMVLTLLPTAALAASEDEVVLNLKELCTADYASVLISMDATGYKVERFETASSTPTPEPVELNGKTLVLTGTPQTECKLDVVGTVDAGTVILRDLNISNKNYPVLIVEADATVRVEGGVTLSSGERAILVLEGKTLKFTGKGDLTVASSTFGAAAILGQAGSVLTADCTGDISVSAKAPAISSFSSIALHTSGDLTLENTGSSSTVSTAATDSGDASDNTIALSGRNITVEATQGTAAPLLSTSAVSMVATGDVLLKNTYAGNHTPIFPESAELDVTAQGTYTVETADSTTVIKDGVTTVTANASNGIDLSARTQEVHCSAGGGTLDFVPGDSTATPVVPAKVTLNDAVITASGNALVLPKGDVELILNGNSSLTSEAGVGVMGPETALNVTAEGGATLTAFGKKAAIQVSSVTVNSGALKLSAGAGDGTALVVSNITLLGGTVTASVPQGGMNSAVSVADLILKNDAALISASTVQAGTLAVSDTATLQCPFLNLNSTPTITSPNVDALACYGDSKSGPPTAMFLVAYGDAVLNDYAVNLLPLVFTIGLPLTLTIPEGATLTVPKGLELYLPTLTSLSSIAPAGIINNGEVYLPAKLVSSLDTLNALDIQGSGPVTLTDENGNSVKSYLKVNGTYCNYGGEPVFSTDDEKYAGTTTYFDFDSASGHVIFTPGSEGKADQIELNRVQLLDNSGDNFSTSLHKDAEVTLEGDSSLISDGTLFGYSDDRDDEEGSNEPLPSINLTFQGSGSLYLEQSEVDGGSTVLLQPGSLTVGGTARVTAGSPLFVTDGVAVGPKAVFNGLVISERVWVGDDENGDYANICTAYGDAAIKAGQQVSVGKMTFSQGATLTVDGILFLPAGTTGADIAAMGLLGSGLISVDDPTGGSYIFKCDGSELSAPKEIDCSGNSKGDLAADGYHWDAETGTLSLNNVFTGEIILPAQHRPITIDSTGDCFLYDALDLASVPSHATHITFSGSGVLTLNGGITQGGTNDFILVDKGATVKVLDTISLGASGNASSVLIVDGSLTVNGTGNGAAVTCGNVCITETGRLTVSGEAGVKVVGSDDGNPSFAILDGGVFTSVCTDYNVLALSGTTKPTDANMNRLLSLPAGYLPSDWSIQSVCNQESSPATYAAVFAPQDASLTFESESVTGAGGTLTLSKHFTVTLDANGGVCATAAVQTDTDGKLTAALPTAARDGYTFDGWFTAAEDGTQITLDSVFTESVTVYAHWTEKAGGGSTGDTSTGGGSGSSSACILTFNVNGGRALAQVSKTRGATVDLTAYVPTRTDYTFAGWFSDAALTKAVTSVKLTGNVTVYAKWTANDGAALPFTDVTADDYYFDAVDWAVNKNITGGTTATTFAPDITCTRAQTVTFLWRASGSPAPAATENPFTDVDDGAYYYNAVLWAVENGITGGTTATTFSPNATVTRGQMATFLWRAVGSPAATGVNPFGDVSADAYYYNAVLWAVENGITGGTSATTFSPLAGATRAQIVTFLYRHLGK